MFEELNPGPRPAQNSSILAARILSVPFCSSPCRLDGLGVLCGEFSTRLSRRTVPRKKSQDSNTKRATLQRAPFHVVAHSFRNASHLIENTKKTTIKYPFHFQPFAHSLFTQRLQTLNSQLVIENNGVGVYLRVFQFGIFGPRRHLGGGKLRP